MEGAWAAVGLRSTRSPDPLTLLCLLVSRSAAGCGLCIGLQGRRAACSSSSDVGARFGAWELEFEERPGRVGGLEWPTVMPSSRALKCACGWVGSGAWKSCVRGRFGSDRRRLSPRPRGLRCSVCSVSILYGSTLALAGHVEALWSVRGARHAMVSFCGFFLHHFG